MTYENVTFEFIFLESTVLKSMKNVTFGCYAISLP